MKEENKNNFYSCKAIIVGFFFLILFTLLLFCSRINGWVYFGLVSMAILCSLIIYFSNSIKEFDLKEMRVILKQTQTVKQEINEVALSMVEIMAYQSVCSTGSWLNRKKLNDKVEALLDNVKIDLSKKESILELPRLMEKFMRGEPLTKAQQEKIDKVFDTEE